METPSCRNGHQQLIKGQRERLYHGTRDPQAGFRDAGGIIEERLQGGPPTLYVQRELAEAMHGVDCTVCTCLVTAP